MGIEKKSHQRRAKGWLRQLSSSPPPLVTLTIPVLTSDSFDIVAMTSNPVIQLPED